MINIMNKIKTFYNNHAIIYGYKWYIYHIKTHKKGIMMSWYETLSSLPALDNVVLGLLTKIITRMYNRNIQTWWRHQMKTFSASPALYTGNSPATGEFPAQRPVTQSFGVFLICSWLNAWVNNGEAGHLRRHRAHHDVTVMKEMTCR